MLLAGLKKIDEMLLSPPFLGLSGGKWLQMTCTFTLPTRSSAVTLANSLEPDPEFIKLFPYSTQLSTKFILLIKC